MTDDIFEQVKEANQIQDVIEEAGFQLRRSSARYMRAREHDSFVVDVQNQAFFWNSRQLQGDVITFVQDWKRTDAKGAVEFLARRAGLPDPEWGAPSEVRVATRRREDAFTVAARIFVRRLRNDGQAMAYALGRGWTEETIKEAGLGYTGKGTKEEAEELRQAFEREGVDLDSPAAVAVIGYVGNVEKWAKAKNLEVLPTDWISKQELKGMPSRMLVYPHVYGGRVRYLSCRSVGERKFHYNLPVALAGNRKVYFNQAYSPGDKRCVVVEGQADAVSLGQWGIPAVALAGTAADSQALANVRERHEHLYIAVDQDQAGQTALLPIGEALGPLSRLIRWPMAHKDLNDWLQAMAKDGLSDVVKQSELAERALATSIPYVQHVCLQVGKLMGAPRQDGLKTAVRLINSIDDEVAKTDLRGDLAKALGINIREYNALLKADMQEAKDERRGAEDDQETIVETVGGYFGGWLVELTYDAETETTGLVYRDPTGNVGEATKLDIEGTRYIPVRPNNLMLQEVILFPSQLGPKKTTKELVDLLVDFLARYYDFKGDMFFMKLSAYYALFTWVYDSFQVVPYLRALGDYGTGKTQMIWRVGHLCYRLTKTSGASTLSPIFRIINKYRGTLFLDEADFGKSDATIEIIKLLNTGYMKGVPMLRSRDSGGGDFEIDPFNVFGPKLIATRELFQDKATESRCLTMEVMGGPVKRGIPRILNKGFYQEALSIRNMLLTWRMYTWQEEIEVSDDDFDSKIEDRLNQVTMSLKKLVADEEMKVDIQEFIRTYNQKLILERSDTLEAKILEALVKIRDATPKMISGEPYWDLTIGNVTLVANEIIDEQNRMLDPEAEERRQKTKKDLSPRGVGAIIDKKLNLRREKRTRDPNKGRFEVIWDEERIVMLCERYGVESK